MEPYTVVMGCHGTTAAERFFFGSNTVYALKHLHWPIIAVPANFAFAGIKKIAFASDLDKDLAKTALALLKNWVTDFMASLHIVNFGKQEQFYENSVFASGALQRELKVLDPQFHFITGENTEDAITQFVLANQIDLLVVLHKTYGFFENIFHKSQTKQFALYSAIPLLVLHE